MNNLFSVGELARLQNISRQTLIFYDKIGLFCPAYTDPANGYRYYSAKQLDYLDTICIMKKIGFSLEEIKAHMHSYTIDHSIAALRRQLSAIEQELTELQLVKSRVEHRCAQLEAARTIRHSSQAVTLETVQPQHLLLQAVPVPHSLEQVSIATKECFARAFREHLPVFYQSGAIVPLDRIRQQRYTEAAHVFLPIGAVVNVPDVLTLPEGQCACTYHVGDYGSIGSAYQRLLDHCEAYHLHITSNAYEFAMNDYLSTGDENEYITKIMLYVQPT